jgi:hypothetical protein
MIQAWLLENKNRVIVKIKDNQPLIVLISLAIVISSLSKLSEPSNLEIQLFAIAASIFFFIALIGSILTDLNGGLLFILLFYFGLGFGFLFLFLVIISLIQFFLPPIYIHILVLLVLLTTFIATAINGLNYCISLIRVRENVSFKKKLIAVLFEFLQILGLIIYAYSHLSILYSLITENIFDSNYLLFIIISIIIIIIGNANIVLTLKQN